MDSSTVLMVSLVVLVPAALLWGIFLYRSGRPSRQKPVIPIPQALRPGQPDEVLEGPRLERIQVWGLVATLALALFIPAYWLPEKTRQAGFEEKFHEHSIARGEIIFQPPAALAEDTDPLKFKSIEKSISLGMGCATCHGADASGGIVKWSDPASGRTVQYKAPPLNNVFQRWDDEVVRFTIERGRPGTPMPAWGVAYGGPMTEMMVDDVMEWLHSLPGNQPGAAEPLADDATGGEIFSARCAVCHGPNGQGREGKGTLEDPWYQGPAIWGSDVTHLTPELHRATIINGRRFAFMPPWGESPAEGIPVPPNPLTDEQIEAVMEYERSLEGPDDQPRADLPTGTGEGPGAAGEGNRSDRGGGNGSGGGGGSGTGNEDGKATPTPKDSPSPPQRQGGSA